ncbi:MAG: sulfite exporter TauE/SafE family protein [Candidatus Staskawiczbacteria bacterium]|nr:sulfite exporter TauE/SafE family protein [Candidatus Staskawiczbacteria bacterium]
MNKHIYKVKGMHCASCEILIEKKLLDLQNIKSADASTSKGEVVIQFEGERPNPERLSKIFKEENYEFSELALSEVKGLSKQNNGKKLSPTLVGFNIAIIIIIAFLLLDKMGMSGFLNVGSQSSLIVFLGFGFLASVSSCAALVGGIVLSMSKQWNSLYAENAGISKKLQPHIMFNAGRVVSYFVLGGVLGLIGSKLQISLQVTSFFIIAISFLMIALGLQMLGVRAFRKFKLALPKSVTRNIANENNFQGKYMPFVMGALTFFLPCGFTITAQSLALLSGSVVNGSLIMGAFALGTVPMMLFIGLSSVKFFLKPHLAERFSKMAGFLVLFFALYNISAQINVLGFTGFDNIFSAKQAQQTNQNNLPPVINGKQLIKMVALASSDSPNYFKVKSGVPVRWEITADSSRGCNSAVVANGLFEGQIALPAGQVSVKEFTPQKAGRYRFSCTMGMVSGTIEVIN